MPVADVVAAEPQENNFRFPFKPYQIQSELMSVAYEVYDKSKFALLESPTGTGKSLSLICSSLKWLRDHQASVKAELNSRRAHLESELEELKREEETDWISAQGKQRLISEQLKTVQIELDKIIEFECRNEARRHAKLHDLPLENYSSFRQNKRPDDGTRMKEPSTSEIVGSQKSDVSNDVDQAEDDLEKCISNSPEDYIKPKLCYASRTHSQLGQFINEIKRTVYADIKVSPAIKVTPLGSRANFCINLDVLKLKDPSAINERCMEMQKETAAEKKCPYMKGKQVNLLKEDILSSVQDIEDIVGRGRSLGACPYYASRLAIPESEMIVLPYNNLLHNETRQACSLDLRESVVIVDEAHNILETICSIHSASISGTQLIGAHTILSRYYIKYHTRMSPRNAFMVKTTVQCLTELLKYLNNPRKCLEDYESPKVIDINDLEEPHDAKNAVHGRQDIMTEVKKFIGSAGLERFNLFKMMDYFNRSQLARKLLGFYRRDDSVDLSLDTYGLDEKKQENDNAQSSPKKKKRKVMEGPAQLNDIASRQRNLEQTNLSILTSANKGLEKMHLTSYPIYVFVEFLKSLTNLADDGRILTEFIRGNIQQSSLKFVLLNPSSQFKKLAEESRSIVLAGGTMQPFDEFVDLLFGPLDISKERIVTFSCDHVINSDHLYVSTLSHGPSGRTLELSYKTKSNFDNLDEIGRTVMNLASVAPGGLVCFLPSYEYEQICFDRWTKMGIISSIETKYKQVFREPRKASHLKTTFEEYCRVVDRCKGTRRGAMLTCVVGGKMSEGINFSDDLGRCIVVIGLPYANIKSGELQQKMTYYDKICSRSGKNTVSAGQQYYENLCIKGVNQSIGRAIRHRDDYAAIVLLDRRFSMRASIQVGLPNWIRKSMIVNERFGPMFGQLKSFFNNKK